MRHYSSDLLPAQALAQLNWIVDYLFNKLGLLEQWANAVLQIDDRQILEIVNKILISYSTGSLKLTFKLFHMLINLLNNNKYKYRGETKLII